MEKFDWRKLLVYVTLGFFIGYLISAVFAPGSDICGIEGSKSSPLIFILIAIVLLVVFFFISNLIKKDLYFILLIAVFAILFEHFVAQPYIVKSDLDIIGLIIAMPLVHLAIFYIPRMVAGKMFKQHSK